MEIHPTELTEQEQNFCARVLSATYSRQTFQNEIEVNYVRALLDAVTENVNSLPPPERKVILLHLREGKPKEEIVALTKYGNEERVNYLIGHGFILLRHPQYQQKYRPFVSRKEEV